MVRHVKTPPRKNGDDGPSMARHVNADDGPCRVKSTHRGSLITRLRKNTEQVGVFTWRRGRDSNSRVDFRRPTGLAIPPLQPLGYLSMPQVHYLIFFRATSMLHSTPMEKPLVIKIIVGSTRQNRFGDKPATWIAQIARQRPEMQIEVLDLREWPFPFFESPMPPSMVKDGAYTQDLVKAWAKKIGEADGYIVVTPEYSHSIPAVLKNALDVVFAEWNRKAIGFVAYGGMGGARAVEHLRQIAVELQMAPLRAAVHIPQPWNLLAEDGSLKTGALEPFQSSADTMLDQLIWWAQALKTARATL